MNTVQPIRDLDMIQDISIYLEERDSMYNMLFQFGIYSGLRITDALNIRVRDVRDKEYIYIREEKTGKEKRFPINPELREVIDEYIEDKKDYEYLFKSSHGKNKPITRQRAWQILNEAAEKFDLENIGCHSLRKTFGYWMYANDKDVVILQEIFNHSSPSITLRYIGIEQDKKDSAMRNLSFKKRGRDKDKKRK